jgi:2-polyprenyl-6-methoxyphenol hydroxylase-like FAD-dependent oxidoreductase
VVSGLSVTGMVGSAILAHAGYDVLAVDRRVESSRSIQWAGRQSLIDQLARLDPGLADRFLGLCGPIYQGSTRIHVDGRREVKAKPFPRRGDSGRVPTSAEEMLESPACFLVAATEIERLLRGYLGSLPTVTVQLGQSLQIGGMSSSGRYFLANGLEPDLLVIAEGAGSLSRSRVGITRAATSPQRRQIAGQVFGRDDGSMVKQLRHRGDDILETGTISQRGRGSTWVVGDIALTGTGGRHGVDRTRAMSKREVRQDFAATVAQVIGEPVSKVLDYGMWGPGRFEINPRAFVLQQHLVRQAWAGRNVVLMGDAVGNGHWNEGGGMQIGAVCHAERLRRLVASADSSGGVDYEAVRAYSDGVVDDTRDWGERGIAAFFPTSDADAVVAAYRRSVARFRLGAAEAPVAALLEEFTGSTGGESDPQLFAVGADGAVCSRRNS